MQAHPPEVARVTAGGAIATDLGEARAPRRLQRTPALRRGRVEQQQIVAVPWRAGGEDPNQPLERLRQASPALVQGILSGERREEMAELTLGCSQETPIRRDPHQHLGDTEGYDFGVRQPAAGIGRPLGQEVVGRAVDRH